MKYIGESVYLRFYEVADAAAVLELHSRNREFFELFVPTRQDSFYTLEEQVRRLEDAIQKRDAAERYAFGIFLQDSGELIGDITLFNVVREPLHTCMVGYCLDKRQNGKGYMTEAIRLAVRFAFGEGKFHRIEAGVMPRNPGSMRALEKAGFQREGLARKNVKINGTWEDHWMFAILEEDMAR